MTVLVGCECSQRVALAFRDAGHIAYSCDIQPAYGGAPGIHIKGDIREVFDKVKPDLFIAHPPCTFLSNAGACRMFSGGSVNKERYNKMQDAVKLFMWCLNAPAPLVCVENPIPLGIAGLPKATQIIEPYMFGDPYTKKTCLWLRGGLPELAPTYYVKPVGSWTDVHRSQRIRSETFPGIAKAMAEQWGAEVLENYQYRMEVYT